MIRPMVILLLLLLAAPRAWADPFINTTEPTDANTLLADDFSDRRWYEKDCDAQGHPTASNPAPGGSKGWCGTIYNGAGLSAGTVVCGGKGAAGLDCAATSGRLSGTTGNMADHALKGFQGVDDIWVRVYTKPLAGYSFGAEKMLTFNDGNPGDAGIRWGNLSWNCATGGASSTGRITMGFPVPEDVCQGQNVGNDITITSGNYYYYEVHFKLATPGQSNGLFELWVNNCGTDGRCTGTPTLRMRRTNVKMDRTSANQLIRVLWLENWSNPTSSGERYWSALKVSKVGPIGFFGATGTPPPPPPVAFKLTATAAGAGSVVLQPSGGSYAPGTMVAVTAIPVAGGSFLGWSDACVGMAACNVTMTADKGVTATFGGVPPPPPPPPGPPMISVSPSTDAAGGVYTVTWPEGGTYPWAAGYSTGGAPQQGSAVSPFAFRLPYVGTAAANGWVCVGQMPNTSCAGVTIPAKPIAVPPPLLKWGVTMVPSDNCKFLLDAEAPDATGGWTLRFMRGATAVGAAITAPPYHREVELPKSGGAYTFSGTWTKGATSRALPVLAAMACAGP